MITIQNGTWGAKISEAGAELKSLAHLPTGREHIWHGDPAWWNGSAPVLFPIVGGLKGNQYAHEGRTYTLSQHGFARGSEFSVSHAGEDSASFTLNSSAKTREVYPFDFSLKVSFQLERAGISVRYDVTNIGSGRMLFSIGSHPAFVIPFAGGALENYYVLFDQEEDLERWFLKDGVIVAGKTAEILENRRVLNVTRSSFNDGALVFKHPRSRELTIANSLNAHAVKVITDGMPYLGIWAKPGGAPFLCIEPWHGIADMSDTSGNLADKEGILSLEPRGVFTTGYRVEIS